MSDNINTDAAPEGGVATSDSRKVQAIYSELLLPFTKQWQAQLSGRYDHYQQVGRPQSEDRPDLHAQQAGAVARFGRQGLPRTIDVRPAPAHCLQQYGDPARSRVLREREQ